VLTALMSAFSLLALLLAAVGVYALVSFSVERRSQELGIRSALGAATSKLVGMVVGETVVIVTVGITVGFGLAVVAARGLEGMLFGIESFDPVTFIVAALLLVSAAAAAALVPGMRAARTDPVNVLRKA
jgi:ABC-type antimicrobial peptide transport system permease subunit